MVDIPRAQPLPTGVTDASLGRGLAQGWEAGNKMGYVASQTKAQDIQNQYAPQAAKLAADAQAAKIKKDQIDSALNFLGTVGEKLKFLPPDSQKKAIANGMNALDKAAPEWGIGQSDPTKIPDDGIDLIQQYGKLRGAHQSGELSDPDFMVAGQELLSKMSQYQRDMLKESEGVLGSPTYEPGQTPTGGAASFNTKTGQVVAPGGQPMGAAGAGFVPASTAASTKAENTRKSLDEVKQYETSVRPYVDAHNNFKQMQKIANQADKSGTNVDPWSFINAYVHTVDPSFSGVLNAQTYKDLRISGSPITAMIPGGEKYLTSSKLDPNDAMRMLQIAKQQDKQHVGRARDIMGVTQKLVGSLGGDPSLIKDFTVDAPITRQLKSGRTAVSHDGGVTWQPQ